MVGRGLRRSYFDSHAGDDIWLADEGATRRQIGTLLNWPMQSNGGEMLRIACCLAVNRGIKIIAPVHDAILVEGPAEDINDVVADLTKCMVEASRAVLGGPAVRVDSKLIHYPNRYIDDRDGALKLWE